MSALGFMCEASTHFRFIYGDAPSRTFQFNVQSYNTTDLNAERHTAAIPSNFSREIWYVGWPLSGGLDNDRADSWRRACGGWPLLGYFESSIFQFPMSDCFEREAILRLHLSLFHETVFRLLLHRAYYLGWRRLNSLLLLLDLCGGCG